MIWNIYSENNKSEMPTAFRFCYFSGDIEANIYVTEYGNINRYDIKRV